MQKENCLFCNIVSGKVPSKKVYEDQKVIAFLDINPRNPGHTLVIPKDHHDNIFDIPSEEAGELFKRVKKVSAMVRNGTKCHGISISQSNGVVAGQVIPHMHFHVIPRFEDEGPVSLEGILQVKKMDDQTLGKVAERISQANTYSDTKPATVQKAQNPKETPKDRITEDDFVDVEFE